jgi:formylglycine-generating enzyme required for sulfatase activity
MNPIRMFLCLMVLVAGVVQAADSIAPPPRAKANKSSAAATAPQTSLPAEVVINSVELIKIPAGWFWHAVEVEKLENLKSDTRRYRNVKIWLDDYYIAKYEARARDFQRFLNATASEKIAQFAAGNVESCSVRIGGDGKYMLIDPERDLPATNLSWPIADEFARWMGMRLLSEAEWTKAARGADKRIWPWGNEHPDDTLANFGGGSTCSPLPVDSRPAGASPFGVVNLSGNVFELIADWYNDKHDKALKDGARNPPLAKTGTVLREFNAPYKILKGGRWASEAAGIAIAPREFTSTSGAGFLCYGTRFAMNAEQVKVAIDAGRASIVRQ